MGEMEQGYLEVFVEPFVEGAPGPHVLKVVEILSRPTLDTTMGPFATTAKGPVSELASALDSLVSEGFAAGATSIQIRVEKGDPVPSAPLNLHTALARAVAIVEQEFGDSLDQLGRADKQIAVRRLNDQGVFLLRGAVEEIAERMGVSRVTLYNYLNAIQG